MLQNIHKSESSIRISCRYTSLFLASQPICCSSPGSTGSEIRSGAITSLACAIATPVKIDKAECSVLNQAAASDGSGARRTQLWMPSGECSSKHRFSKKSKILVTVILNFAADINKVFASYHFPAVSNFPSVNLYLTSIENLNYNNTISINFIENIDHEFNSNCRRWIISKEPKKSFKTVQSE